MMNIGQEKKSPMRLGWALFGKAALVALLFPGLAWATTPYPRLIWMEQGEEDFDLDAAVEMVDDGTGGDDLAGDGIYTATVVFPEDGGAGGPGRTFLYRIVPPDTLPSEAIGGAGGEDLEIALPDGLETEVRFFFSTARSTEIPTTADCPDEETLLSCLGFGPVPSVSDDWNTSGTAAAIGDHQAYLGGSTWDAAQSVVHLEPDPDLGESRLVMTFLAGVGFEGSEGWQPHFDGPGGAKLLGPDGWQPADSGPGTPFDLEADPWRVVRFELLPHRGMARATVLDGTLPKPLLTEVVTDPAAPFLEIHNPADHPLSLAGLHVTNHPGYPRLGVDPTEVEQDGFVARFPEAAFVEAGAWFTVSLVSAAAFESAWGRSPSFVLPDQGGANELEPSYASPAAIGSSPTLEEGGGFAALIHHLPSMQRAMDVDLVTWGSPDAARALPDKSGMDAGSETYGDDSMRAVSMPAAAGPFMARRDFTEGGQRTSTGYNGLFDPAQQARHDETDEPLEQTWALAAEATPGEPPDVFLFVVSGEVTAAENDEPIEDASVQALPSGPSTTTDEDGLYSMELEAGSWTIEASAHGYRPASREVTLDGDAIVDLELEREPGVVIGGRVRDDLDRWVSGARVDLVGGQRNRDTTTEPDGSFVFTGVQPDTLYTITASLDGYRSDSRNLQIGESDLFDVLLTLTYVPISFSVSGRVIDADTEEPITGAIVDIPSLGATTTTGLEGDFVFRLVPPGDHELTVRAEGYADASLQVTVDDEDIEDLEIPLGRDGDSLSLSGTVTIAGLGLPIGGADVSLTCEEDIRRETTTDARGMYVFLGLSAGTYGLTVTADGYDPHHETLEMNVPTDHDVALETPPGQGFTLSGNVRLEGRDSGSWGGSTVALADADDPSTPIDETRTDSDGSYRFDALSPSRYRLDVSSSGYVPAGMTVEVASNTSQHFVLQPVEDSESDGVLGCECTSTTSTAGWVGPALLLLGLLLRRNERESSQRRD